MKFLRGYVYTHVEGTDDELEWLHTRLTTRLHGYVGGEFRTWKRYHFHMKWHRFPSGLLFQALRKAENAGHHVELHDKRVVPNGAIRALPFCLQHLHQYQRDAIDIALRKQYGILEIATSGGKCLGAGTPVLKYDGSIVPVESISAGDWLIGPDSVPRLVRRTSTGTGELYRITPIKGDPWVCNADHVLTLVHTVSGMVVDVSLIDWLNWPEHKRHVYKLFQPGPIEFGLSDNKLPIDPYFIGVWYGDGRRNLNQGVQVSKPDKEIETICKRVADTWGLHLKIDRHKPCPTYRLSIGNYGRKCNPLLNVMRDIIPKHGIPTSYKTASVEDRLQLLAGLLDTDGYLGGAAHSFFEIVQKRKCVATDIMFIARSLGFRVTSRVKVVNGVEYQRLNILGDVYRIPTRIPRKQAQKKNRRKNVLRTGFRVEAIGQGTYYGFTLTGDGRFLLGDYTITHNTEVSIGLAMRVPGKTLFIVDEKSLLRQATERWEKYTNEKAGVIGGGEYDIRRFTVATFQTLHRKLKDKAVLNDLEGFACLIIDEAHVTAARTYFKVAMKVKKAYWRIGMSATPTGRSDNLGIMVVAATGGIIYREGINDLIYDPESDRLVPVDIIFYAYPKQKSVSGGNHHEVRLNGIVENQERNRAIMRLCRIATHPTLLFFEEHAHGKELTRMLKNRGKSVLYIDGGASTDMREDAKKLLSSGEIDILVASRIFNKGADIPGIRSCINAAGKKSTITALQRLGRGLRTTKGKVRLEYYDLYDRHHRTLQDHSRERIQAYENVDLCVKRYKKIEEIVKWLSRERVVLELDSPTEVKSSSNKPSTFTVEERAMRRGMEKGSTPD